MQGPALHAPGVGVDSSPVPSPPPPVLALRSGDRAQVPPPPSTPLDPTPAPEWAGRPGSCSRVGPPGDSRVAHVDPRDDLVAGLAREAVAAAAVREQVVEILHREIERAGHGGGGALHAGAGASQGEKPGQRGGAAQQNLPVPPRRRARRVPEAAGAARRCAALRRGHARPAHAPQDPGARP